MSIVYINNSFLEEENATISIFDRGFLFGDGFFETIRCQNGSILFLKDHLERLSNSCEQFQIVIPNLDQMHSIIKELLVNNDLLNSIAAVKIIITRGNTDTLYISPVDNPTIIVTARKYTPYPEALYISGLSLVPFPYTHQNFLAKNKSLNYFFYINALSYAKEKGAHDAIIMDPNGNILEGAITNIMIYNNSTIFTPPSSFDILTGITQKYALDFLQKKDFKIIQKSINLTDVYSAEEIIVTNSLLLSASVKKMGEKYFNTDNSIANILREYFLSL